MSLQSGHKLAHYEIVEPIGKGGMGEVYRAKDTKLDRDVAIKVLPDEFAQDEERLRRFQREAKVLASLNHPNIASIYGLEQSGETHYLVLELVPGETLAERIARGPIPIDDAFAIATEIAEALEEAHERGIVHRDLKPANVKLTEDGKIKVLDFGLAKAFVEDVQEGDAATSMSPTITRDATRVGVILGTAAYMSPEQAKGKRVDKRADIWAFGVVLYEMLTGKRAFAGEDVSEVLAAVIQLEPDWDQLAAGTPPRARELLERCLRKDPSRRLHAVADARIELEDLDSGALDEAAPATHQPSWILFGAGFALASLAAGLVYWTSRDVVPRPEPTRVAVQIPSSENIVFDLMAPVISPDGRYVAYVVERDPSTRQLFIRSLDRFQSTPVEGTEGILYSPFFSPDSQWLGYYANDELKKVALDGSLPVTLATIEGGATASWGRDGTIFVSDGRQLMGVPENGGEPIILYSAADGENNIYWPEVIPGEQVVLYSSIQELGSSAAAVELDSGERVRLVEGAINPHYLESGHLVFQRGDRLFAARFDPRALELAGPPRPVVEDVLPPGAYRGQFSLSRNGHLLYVPNTLESLGRIVWVDRTGQAEPVSESRRSFIPYPRLSPDGRRIAVTVSNGGVSAGADIWLLETRRETLTRLTYGGGSFQTRPHWFSDGRSILHWDNSADDLVSRPVDGSGDATVLLDAGPLSSVTPTWLSPDGELVLFHQGDVGSLDVGMLVLDGKGEPELLLDSAEFSEHSAVVSPDGGVLAYVSNESGVEEVYLREFPTLADRKLVSTGGGTEPVWSRDGQELFYRDGNRMMAVRVNATGSGLVVSAPEILFEKRFQLGGIYGNPATNYDVATDGRFIMIEEGAAESSGMILHLILNWVSELERLVPSTN